jgi:hypothetical protein
MVGPDGQTDDQIHVGVACATRFLLLSVWENDFGNIRDTWGLAETPNNPAIRACVRFLLLSGESSRSDCCALGLFMITKERGRYRTPFLS